MASSERLRLALWLALGLTGCGDTYKIQECLPLPDDGVCPTAAKAGKIFSGRHDCGYTITSINGGAEIMLWQWESSSDTAPSVEACCYPATARLLDDGCVTGRPMIVGGEIRGAPPAPRSDWVVPLGPALNGLSEGQRRLIGGAWLRAATGEHASVAAFSRLALELLRHGAPPQLVRDAHHAALDEVRHAEMAYGLASAYLGRRLGPGPLPLPGQLALASTPAELALAAASEGCRDETLAALLAADAADRASDPAVREVLRQVAADEARHAALSWRVLRWSLALAPEATTAVGEILTAACPNASVPEPDHDALVAHGVLGAEATTAVHRRGMERVVASTWRALASQTGAG